jgi:His-Xaa-Ser system protein HxsD
MKSKNNTVKLLIDPKIYPPEAIYGAGYVFIDQAYLFLTSRSSGKIEVSLKGKKKLSKKQLESLAGEFSNELLNYTLRINLAKYNKKIREYVVSRALFSAVETEKINQEKPRRFVYEKDPLGIAIPWEEKYGKKKKYAH